jgi:hypothetical protein
VSAIDDRPMVNDRACLAHLPVRAAPNAGGRAQGAEVRDRSVLGLTRLR